MFKNYLVIIFVLILNISCAQKVDNELNINPSFLEDKDTEKVFEAILDDVYSREIPKDLKDFENPIKNLVYLFDMHGQVINGGVLQFVDNSTGDYFEETLQALKDIEASEYVEILESFKKLFPNGYIPKDTSARRVLIDEIHEKIANEKTIDLDEFYDKLDDKYYDNELVLKNQIILYVKKMIKNKN